jgi:hypothetical protein
MMVTNIGRHLSVAHHNGDIWLIADFFASGLPASMRNMPV